MKKKSRGNEWDCMTVPSFVHVRRRWRTFRLLLQNREDQGRYARVRVRARLKLTCVRMCVCVCVLSLFLDSTQYRPKTTKKKIPVLSLSSYRPAIAASAGSIILRLLCRKPTRRTCPPPTSALASAPRAPTFAAPSSSPLLRRAAPPSPSRKWTTSLL